MAAATVSSSCRLLRWLANLKYSQILSVDAVDLCSDWDRSDWWAMTNSRFVSVNAIIKQLYCMHNITVWDKIIYIFFVKHCMLTDNNNNIIITLLTCMCKGWSNRSCTSLSLSSTKNRQISTSRHLRANQTKVLNKIYVHRASFYSHDYNIVLSFVSVNVSV